MTHQGLHSDDIEKICRDLEALHALWRVCAGKVGAPPSIDSELLKGLVLRAPVKIVRYGNFVAFDSVAGNPFPHRNDAIEIRKLQRLESQCGNEAAARGVCADAQSQRS